MYNVDVSAYVMYDEWEKCWATVSGVSEMLSVSYSECERKVREYGGSVIQEQIVFTNDEGVEEFTHYINRV